MGCVAEVRKRSSSSRSSDLRIDDGTGVTVLLIVLSTSVRESVVIVSEEFGIITTGCIYPNCEGKSA